MQIMVWSDASVDVANAFSHLNPGGLPGGAAAGGGGGGGDVAHLLAPHHLVPADQLAAHLNPNLPAAMAAVGPAHQLVVAGMGGGAGGGGGGGALAGAAALMAAAQPNGAAAIAAAAAAMFVQQVRN